MLQSLKSDKKHCAAEIKEKLQALQGKIEGLVSCKAAVGAMTGSDADAALIVVFGDEAALQRYQEHTLHPEVKKFVGFVRETRCCFDFNGEN